MSQEGSKDSIRIFEIARGEDVDLSVELPTAWAQEHGRVQVMLEHRDVGGWHAVIESLDGQRVVSFPWYDHADKMLRGEVPSQLPDRALPAEGWDGLEQGWWAVIRPVGDVIFVAETDLDSLLDVNGMPTPRLVRRGVVDLAGVEVVWSRVTRAAWDHAWAAAKSSCVQGSPYPSRTPRVRS